MTNPDTESRSARTAAATAASVARRRRGRQERLAGELTSEGWQVRPPEADPLPTEPGVYLSDTLHDDPTFGSLGSAAVALWIRCLADRKHRLIVDGKAAIPAPIAYAMKTESDAIVRLTDGGVWTYDTHSGCYLFEGAGRLYAIVGDGEADDAPRRGR